ncbi:MAG TPA: glycerophosphodiester phosphodiesterase [Candidatus Binatia bacterium]|nr:glycerophosphodiester phosphodiesterase [Candidatus Binatia bacterium]
MAVWLDQALLAATDALYALRPLASVTPAQAARTRIVSHRGERDDRTVFENTFAAFDRLRGTGVHALECDVRWTADLVPVVYHDADLGRLHGDATPLRSLTADELRARRPEIPLLAELVRRYADEFHLMIEVKPEPYPDPPLQDRRLAEALAPALGTGRCHVLSLQPALFRHLPSLPAERTMSVARFDAAPLGAEALAARRGGFSTHYALLSRAAIGRHHAAGQCIGCGFPRSRAVLHREIARGVDYVFTNQALRLERWRQALLAAVPRPGTPAPRR